MGETELAWIAAERSLPAAQSAELPLLLAASAYHLGHVFLRAGQVEEATNVAMTAARALEPGSGLHPTASADIVLPCGRRQAPTAFPVVSCAQWRLNSRGER